MKTTNTPFFSKFIPAIPVKVAKVPIGMPEKTTLSSKIKRAALGILGLLGFAGGATPALPKVAEMPIARSGKTTQSSKIKWAALGILGLLGLAGGVGYYRYMDKNPFQCNANHNNITNLNGIPFDELQNRLIPKSYSIVGFIGANEKVKDILIEDTNTVCKFGLSHKQIADRLDEVLQSRKLQEKLSLIHSSGLCATGYQGSPFGDGRKNNCDEHLTAKCGEGESCPSVPITSFTSGFIRDYGFYNGRGVWYRTDPEKLIPMIFTPKELLNFKPK